MQLIVILSFSVQVCLRVDQIDGFLFKDPILPRPLCVHVEEVLDERLSCLVVVAVKHHFKVEAPRRILIKEVLNGPGNEDHD